LEVLLKWTIMVLALAVSGTVSACDGQAAERKPRHMTVDLVAINGDELIVKDESGSEGRIHVGTDTEKYGHFQPGDRIEAWIYPDGHAKTIVIIRSAAVIQEDQADQQQPSQR
jgi:hypothetical protein